MGDKYYRRTDVRLNEEEKQMLDDISESLKLELDTDRDNESEVLRLAINTAYNNKHLIDKEKADAIFDEEVPYHIDSNNVDFFIDDIYSEGILRTDLTLYFNFGYMDVHRGMPLKLIDNKKIRFNVTSSNYFEIDKHSIESIYIYDNYKLCEESQYNYKDRIRDLKKYSYLVRFKPNK